MNIDGKHDRKRLSGLITKGQGLNDSNLNKN